MNNVFDYIELDDEYSIFEIPPMKEWIGHTIQELNVRQTYDISILGIKQGEKTNIAPAADYEFQEQEHLIVLGTAGSVGKILK